MHGIRRKRTSALAIFAHGFVLIDKTGRDVTLAGVGFVGI